MKILIVISFIITAKPKKKKAQKKLEHSDVPLQGNPSLLPADSSLYAYPHQDYRTPSSALHSYSSPSFPEQDAQSRKVFQLDDPVKEYLPSSQFDRTLEMGSSSNVFGHITEDMAMLSTGIREKQKSARSLYPVELNIRNFGRTSFLKSWLKFKELLKLEDEISSEIQNFDSGEYTKILNVEYGLLYEKKSYLTEDFMVVDTFVTKYISNLGKGILMELKRSKKAEQSIFSDLRGEINRVLETMGSDPHNLFFKNHSKTVYMSLNYAICDFFCSSIPKSCIEGLDIKNLIIHELDRLLPRCEGFLDEMHLIRYYIKDPSKRILRYYIVFVLLHSMNSLVSRGSDEEVMKSLDICYHYIMVLLERFDGILRDYLGDEGKDQKFNKVKLLVYDLFSFDKKGMYLNHIIQSCNDSLNYENVDKMFAVEVLLHMTVLLYDTSFSEFDDTEKRLKLENLPILEEALCLIKKNEDIIETSDIVIVCKKIYDFCVCKQLS